MTMDTDVWGGDLPDVHVREVVPATTVDPDTGAAAWTDAVTALGDAIEAARVLGRTADVGAAHKVERLEGTAVVTMVAALQDVRRDLARVESLLAREVGRDEATPRTGTLPDGRRYDVKRGQNRKAWAHDEWKRDVRVAVLARHGAAGVLVDPDTGEQVDVSTVVAEVQQVHGSTAPRATGLRALGLDPDDYAEVVPGTWGVQVQGDAGED